MTGYITLDFKNNLYLLFNFCLSSIAAMDLQENVL